MRKKLFLAMGVLCAIGFLLSGQRPPRATAHRVTSGGQQGLLRDAALEQRVRGAISGAPLQFEENLGQADSRVEFVARGGNFMLGLTPQEADLNIHTPIMHQKRPPQLEPEGVGWADAMAATALVRVEFAGGNPAARLSGVDPQPGIINYIKGNDPSRWRRNVPHYGRVRYEGLYPGIDAVFYGDRRAMEFDFEVAAGADPSVIRMRVEGAGSVQLTEEGGLEARTAAGMVTVLPPRLYQQKGSERAEVAGHFVWRAPGEIGFEVAGYDHSEALVIDPQTYVKQAAGKPAVSNQAGGGHSRSKYGAPPTSPPPTGGSVAFSTQFGGSYDDAIEAIAIGQTSGHVYVAGVTDSYDFPRQGPGAEGYGPGGTPGVNCQIPQSPCGDAFIAEFDVSTITAPVLVGTTLIGGSNDDVAWGLALDGNDDPYIVGQTDSLDFPYTGDAFESAPPSAGSCGTPAQPRPCHHGFIAVLSSDLSSLTYSSYLAGTDDDEAYAVAVDSNGNAFVTGVAGANFPTGTIYDVEQVFQPVYSGGGDAFVFAVYPGEGEALYSTYMGGNSTDAGLGIAVDSGTDTVYVGGVTFSTTQSGLYPVSFFTTGGSLQAASSDQVDCGPGNAFPCGDGFVFTLDYTGSQVNYSTFIGGSLADQVNAITIDANDDVYITGQTQSSDFYPVTNYEGTPYQKANNGGYDAFAVGLYPFAYQSTFAATYLGGGNDDIGLGIAIDSSGDMFISGSTASGPNADPGFPLAPTPTLQTQTNAGLYGNSMPTTSFVSVVSANGTNLLFSTYYGGLYDFYSNYPTDAGTSIALDSSGRIYLAGYTTSYANLTNTANQYGSPGLCLVNPNPQGQLDEFYYNDYNGFLTVIYPAASAAACFSPALVPLFQNEQKSAAPPLMFNFLSAIQNTTNPQQQPQVLTMYNQGSAALSSTISFINLTNANPGDFSETEFSSATGSPCTGDNTLPGGGASCQITVTFKPTASTAAGPVSESATMVITNNGNCPSVAPTAPPSCTVNLQGTDLPPATVTLTGNTAGPPSSVTFPVTQVGTTSGLQVVTLTDTSTTSFVDISSDSITGPGSANFQIILDYCSGGQVQDNGGVCLIYVSFTPPTTQTAVQATYNATLTVYDDGVPSPGVTGGQSITLTGTGVLPPPAVSIPPLSLTFGAQVQGTTSPAQTVTITNSAATGSQSLSVTGLTFMGVNKGDFNATGCTTAVPPNGGTCTISVTFTPMTGAAGARSATLQIADNAPNTPQTIGVSGTDLALPTVSLNPATTLTFGPQALGTTSGAMTVTLSNTSANSPLTITSAPALMGGNMGDFSILSNTCGSTLAASSGCVVSLTFMPSATGTRMTTLQFTDNAASSSQDVTISGTGVTAPTLTSSTAPANLMTFPGTPQGTPSAAMTAVLANPNIVAVPITSITTSGDFSVPPNPCGGSVAANGSCNISVTFTPTATGTRNGILTAVTGFGTLMLNLTGTGAAPPAVTLSPATTLGAPLNFGTQAVGVPTAAMPVMVTNTGGSPLSISAIVPAGDYTETDNCIAMSPLAANGGTCTVMITFTPSGNGTRNGTILIVDNAANSPQTIYTTGIGSSNVPGFAISAPLYFGAVLVGNTSAAQTITITNSGGATLNIMSAVASAEFAVSANTCGMVPIGQSCMISVTFTPTMTGTQSGTLTITDNAPGSPQSVMLSGIGATIAIAPPTGGSTTLTVTPGDTAQYGLTATSTAGLVANLSLSCTSNAPYTICTVSPSTVTLGGTSFPTFTVTVQTNCNPSLVFRPTGPAPILPPPLAALWLGAVVLFVLLRRVAPQSRLTRAVPVLLLLLLVVTWAGCVSNPPPAIPGAPTTPAGTYTVTVTATGTNGTNVIKVLTLTLRVI